MAFRIGAANPSSLKLGNFSVSVIFIFTTLQGWALSEGDAAGPNKEMGGDYTHWASFVAKNVIVIAAISEVFKRVGLHGLLLDSLLRWLLYSQFTTFACHNYFTVLFFWESTANVSRLVHNKRSRSSCRLICQTCVVEPR